jgi:hypothetical protein
MLADEFGVKIRLSDGTLERLKGIADTGLITASGDLIPYRSVEGVSFPSLQDLMAERETGVRGRCKHICFSHYGRLCCRLIRKYEDTQVFDFLERLKSGILDDDTVNPLEDLLEQINLCTCGNCLRTGMYRRISEAFLVFIQRKKSSETKELSGAGGGNIFDAEPDTPGYGAVEDGVPEESVAERLLKKLLGNATLGIDTATGETDIQVRRTVVEVPDVFTREESLYLISLVADLAVSRRKGDDYDG